jgi:hypothetical protein
MADGNRPRRLRSIGIESVDTFPATPRGEACSFGCCGHAMSVKPTANSSVQPVGPRSFMRCSPEEVVTNLPMDVYLEQLNKHGTQAMTRWMRKAAREPPVLMSKVQCVPISQGGLGSDTRDKFRGKSAAFRSSMKMRCHSAIRAPSLSSPQLDPETVIVPMHCRDIILVEDGSYKRRPRVGDLVLVNRQPTEGPKQLAVLMIAGFTTNNTVRLNTMLLDLSLGGDDDGDDLNVFFASQDALRFDLCRAFDASSCSSQPPRDSIIQPGEMASLLLGEDLPPSSPLRAMHSRGEYKDAHIAAFSNLQPVEVDLYGGIVLGKSRRVDRLRSFADSGRVDALKGVVGEQFRLLRVAWSPLEVRGADVCWRGRVKMASLIDGRDDYSPPVMSGLRVAAAVGSVAQKELLSSHKLVALGLHTSPVPSLVGGFEPPCSGGIVLACSSMDWMPSGGRVAQAFCADDFAEPEETLMPALDAMPIRFVMVCEGLWVSVLSADNMRSSGRVRRRRSICEISTRSNSAVRPWARLAAILLVADLDEIDALALEVAVMCGVIKGYDLDSCDAGNAPWTQLADVAPVRLLKRDFEGSIDIDECYSAQKFCRRW